MQDMDGERIQKTHQLLLWEKKRTKLWIVFMSLRLEILLHKDMTGLEQSIYEHLAEKDVSVKIHAHDRNLSINKFIKDTHFTTNQNDLWHAVKAIKKAITNVSKGPKYSHGITWSQQLTD